MGFIVYGTFARFAVDGAHSVDTPMAGWGLIPGTRYWTFNDDDTRVDVIDTAPFPGTPEDVTRPSFSDGMLVEFQKSTHCWAYCDAAHPIDLSKFTFQWSILSLPDGEVVLAAPAYDGRTLQLMWPQPQAHFFETAQSIDASKRVRHWPHKRDVDFFYGLAIWHPHFFRQSSTGLLETSPPVQAVVEPVDPPIDPLRAKLDLMEARLREDAVIFGKVHPGGHSTSSSGFQLIDATPDWERYSFAWYSLSKGVEYDAEDYVRTHFDPEGLVEELYNRYEIEAYFDCVLPDQQTPVFFEAKAPLDDTQLGQLIVTVAQEVGLKATWFGDPSRAIDLAL